MVAAVLSNGSGCTSYAGGTELAVWLASCGVPVCTFALRGFGSVLFWACGSVTGLVTVPVADPAS